VAKLVKQNRAPVQAEKRTLTLNVRLESDSYVRRAAFLRPAFSLLGNPARVFERFLEEFSQYGARIESLTVDTRVLAHAFVSCQLPAIAATAYIRVDRLELDCRGIFVGRSAPDAIWPKLVDMVASLQDGVAFASETQTFNGRLRVLDGVARETIGRLISVPRAGGRDELHGLLAYVRLPDRAGLSRLILEQSLTEEDALVIGVLWDSFVYPSKVGSFQRLRDWLVLELKRLGIEVEAEEQR
jgi:hypothetical protein